MFQLQIPGRRLFLLLVLQVSVNSHAKFFTLDKWERIKDPRDLTSPAHRACASETAQLPDVLVRSGHLALQKYLKEKSLKCAWVNLARRNYTTWLWIDGVQASPDIEKIGHVTGNICGAVDLEVGRIRMRHCSQKKHPFICEERDCQGCITRATPGGQCIRIGSSCYVYNCAKVGWYDARAICRRSGADLALLRKDATIRQLEKFWVDGMDSYAWVGLRKEDWERLDVPGDISYTFTPWATGEPRGQGGKCVQMTMAAGGEYVWRTADCNSKCSVVCNETVYLVAQQVLVRWILFPYLLVQQDGVLPCHGGGMRSTLCSLIFSDFFGLLCMCLILLSDMEEAPGMMIEEGPGMSIRTAAKGGLGKTTSQASTEPRRPNLSSITIVNFVVNLITMMLMLLLGVYVICSRRYRHSSSSFSINEKTPINDQ